MERTKVRKRTGKRKGALQPMPNLVEVVVIDDEHGVRSVLTEALAANGYLVYLADGTNAKEVLTSTRLGIGCSCVRSWALPATL